MTYSTISKTARACAIGLLGLTSLAGCSTEVDSTLSVVTTLPANAAGKTIAVLPVNPNADGPEFRAYAAKLGTHFEKAGYRLVESSGTKPDYIAVFGYGIDRGTEVTKTISSPVYGITGYAMNSMGSTTGRTPVYGVTGYQQVSNTSEVYKGALLLDIFDAAKITPRDPHSPEAARVYQARLISSGGCASLAGIVDPLLEALFQDFPGRNAEAQPVTVFAKDRSC